jgi:hypothetical protein
MNLIVPYTQKINPIEKFFNQIKHHLKLNKKVLKFDELKQETKIAIDKVKKIIMKIILIMHIIKMNLGNTTKIYRHYIEYQKFINSKLFTTFNIHKFFINFFHYLKFIFF